MYEIEVEPVPGRPGARTESERLPAHGSIDSIVERGAVIRGGFAFPTTVNLPFNGIASAKQGSVMQ